MLSNVNYQDDLFLRKAYIFTNTLQNHYTALEDCCFFFRLVSPKYQCQLIYKFIIYKFILDLQKQRNLQRIKNFFITLVSS